MSILVNGTFNGDISIPAVNFADNYGGQIVGYFYPPSTGDYIFYIAADDNAREIERMFAEEAKLRAVVAEKDEQLRRT